MYRVIWKVHPQAIGDFDSTDLHSFALRPEQTTLFNDCTTLVGRPSGVFERPAVALRAELATFDRDFREDPDNDLAGYHHVFVEDPAEAAMLVERLRNEGAVTDTQVQPRLERPYRVVPDRTRHSREPLVIPKLTLDPRPTDDYTPAQGYLAAAPDGIDALHAWTVPGGRGGHVSIVDIEDGWNFQHEDLRQKQIGIVFGPKNDHDHGTAVLGILGGDANGFGVTGVAPEALSAAASASFAVTDANPDGRWNAADAIVAMTRSLQRGDVILLEMHAPGPNAPGANDDQLGYIPIEYWIDDFAAIRNAVAKGIHVVEAGGNGGENLDHSNYDGAFDRAVRDSGAVLVGGGASALQKAPRSRIFWSNYGSRFDVQGWGEDIVTCGGRIDLGYRDLRNDPLPERCYTQSFGGTSGASPIVAGAIAVINGCLLARGDAVLSPSEMRDLLVRTGTPQTDGPDGDASQHIGPLPDLRAALADLGF